MLKRVLVLLVAMGGGYAAAAFWPHGLEVVRKLADAMGVIGQTLQATAAVETSGTSKAPEARPDAELVKLSSEQISFAGIKDDVATGGLLIRALAVPGTIVPAGDQTARIAVKTTGTVAELRKGLGDSVAKGEIVALLDSREIADAKSEYLVARVSAELQKTLYDRDRALWDKRISSEQQYLRSQASYEDLRVKAEAARRKLMFLGLSSEEIDALPKLPAAEFERQEIRSPIAGRIVDRRVEIGTAVGRDNLETELYSVVNLAQVWVELAVAPEDLPLVREGQKVKVSTLSTGDKAEAQIIFIGPVLNKDTRSARVVARLENPNDTWRPGTFVSADIVVAEDHVQVRLPKNAFLKIDGHDTVFVKVDKGYEARRVVVGRSDERMVEVTSGVLPGDTIAVANAFILKAELLKVQAED